MRLIHKIRLAVLTVRLWLIERRIDQLFYRMDRLTNRWHEINNKIGSP